MAIGRVINKHSGLFPDFEEILKNLGKYTNQNDFEFFLQIPNLTKADILEYFERAILILTTGPFGEDNGVMELSSMFFASMFDEIDKMTIHYPTYISEYTNIVAQLFLAGYIDFGIESRAKDKYTKIDYPTNLSYYKEDKYEAWIHFRDNFFYTDAHNRDILDLRERYPNMSDDDYINSTWNTPKYWDMEHFWVARTPKGTKYFNEILSPKFYNKYKDLEVEIDDKGNIIKWIGKINK